MTITLNGTDGITLNNGSADGAQVTLSSSGYNDWNIDNYNGTLRAYNNGTEQFKVTNTGNLQFNSGYGSATTAYACRAWVHYNGSQAIVASANVSSITVLGTGDSQINFTNAMPDANFCAVASTNEDGGTPKYCNPTNPTTAKIRIVTFNSAGTKVNNTYNYVAVFR